MAHDPRETAESRRESEAVTNARGRIAQIAATHGVNHPEYAIGLNQLALLLIMQGNPDAAEPLLREALEVRLRSLGDRHPDYATNLSSLGGLLWARGDLDQAEPLLRQALEVRTETLGSGHPKSVVSLNSLEQLLKAKQDWVGSTAPHPAPIQPRAFGPGVEPVRAAGASKNRPPDTEPVRPGPVDRPEKPAVPGPAVTRTEATIKAPGVEQIAARLDRLTREFAGLGDLLSRTGERLRNGFVPSEADVSAARAGAREEFDGLARDAGAAARADSVPVPSAGFASLADLSTLVSLLRTAEAARSKAESSRREALGVLDRVGRLACAGDPTSAALAVCLDQAREVRRSIESAGAGDLPDVTRRLNEGVHPLNALLQLVTADEATGDAQWADWFDAVSSGLGHSLAVAAARSRVTLSGPRTGP